METLEISLDSNLATDIRSARRGHVVLSFLSHFYIHSQPPSTPKEITSSKPSASRNLFSKLFGKSPVTSESVTPTSSLDQSLSLSESNGQYSRTLPSSLAVPWMKLSETLGIPPVLTYATTVLWNWSLIDPTLPISSSNIKMVTGFTQSKSEDHFYKTSLLMELRGQEALGLMKASLFESFSHSKSSSKLQELSQNLQRLKTIVSELTKILHDVRTDCDPSEFYWGLRPWFRGADSGVPEKGWVFQGVEDSVVEGKEFISEWTGPSAGQSSLIHTLDIFLDVDHTTRKPRKSTSTSTVKGEKGDATFMERMLLHMPREHREFLNFLRNLSLPETAKLGDEGSTKGSDQGSSNVSTNFPLHPIRSLAFTSKSLSKSYDEALIALKNLRDEHMRIATLYIITQSRAKPPSKYAPLPINFTGNLASQLPNKSSTSIGTPKVNSESSPAGRTRRYSKPGDGIAADALTSGAKGTGGTELTTFLRDCRKNTLDALIGKEA